MAGLMSKDAPDTWTDHSGTVRKTPKIVGRLKFKIPLHAALRAHVFTRDRFRCQDCGASLAFVSDYDGRFSPGPAVGLTLVMDHIVSRRRGGSHHPLNLRTLCSCCNSRKACLLEGAGGSVGR